ncbi:MAG: regulatory protein GemA [Azonexus sp.]|jgi:phage gp16-like protein|nr:regulatory protein GemA [Azonexus sp.]
MIYRDKLIQLIHVGKRDLALDEDAYRALLMSAGKHDSTAKMDLWQLNSVLDRMKQCGFKVRHSARGGKGGGKKAPPSRPLDQAAQSKMIRGLWLELHEAKAVRNPSEAALAAYVKRQTGVEALQWLSSEQASRVIEALKKWRARVCPEPCRRASKAAT